jgi:hypothetical protein
MVRCLVSAFFSFIVAASSPGQVDPPKEPQKLRIQGKMIEAKNRQPIRKVTVEVVGGAGNPSGPTRRRHVLRAHSLLRT